MRLRRGIPTRYRGREYRSRLEAHWAALFDMLGWPFEYEPFDLAGWIPDFLLLGDTEVLVEVKPVRAFPEWFVPKIDRANTKHECLIVGYTFPVMPRDVDPFNDGHRVLGWLWQQNSDGGLWGDAVMGQWIAGNGKIGFCHSSGSWKDRISGGYDGNCYGELPFRFSEMIHLWKETGNLVQWHGRRSVVDDDSTEQRLGSTAQGPGLAVQEAIGFLVRRLSAGPVRVSVLRQEVEARKPVISARSLYRAFELINGEEYEEQGRKWWRLEAQG